MTITSLQDALKILAQSLRLSTILPAFVLVFVNVTFVIPNTLSNVNDNLTNGPTLVSSITAVVIVSYLLYAFNIPLIRLVEGYVWREHPALKPWLDFQLSKQLDKYRALREDKYQYVDEAKSRMANQELDTHFPSREEYILPTALGNTIAAFEHYPYTRYGIDAVAIWPRIVPILRHSKGNYLDFVSQQKAVFDFVLNLMVVALICGVELTYLSVYKNQLDTAVVIIALTYLSIKLLYKGTINGAVQWGLSVRVAFDLYREELWKSFHLKPVSYYRDEVKRWNEISNFIKLGDEIRDFDGFLYPTKDP